MAIVGIGTDIAEIERFDRALERSGESFARRILTDFEYVTYVDLNNRSRFLAKRFAAKEAASKALGTGIAAGVTFQDFQVSNDAKGKPILTLANKAKEIALEQGATRYHLSLSDERHYAVATVIFES